jgi:hypothetical protein
MAEYHYIDVVKKGITAGHVRDPRLQKSAIAEFGRFLSDEVNAGEWSQDGDEAINSKGQNVEEYLDHLISTRPHWLVPATVVDAADDTWTSGDLTKQGKRWKELRAFLGNDNSTNAAMAAEAALYGAVPGSKKIGVKPGTQKSDPDVKEAGPSNPWSSKWRGTPAEALTEQTRLIRLGSKVATNMAKAAGVSVFGTKLK